MKRVACVSTMAHQLALNNVAIPCGWKYFDDINYVGVAEYNPDVLYVGGWFVSEYSDLALHNSLLGDIPKVIVHWYGSDVLMCRQWKQMGERHMFEWLKDSRFVHVPPSEPIRREIEEWLGLSTTEPLNVPAERVFDRMDKPEEFFIGCYMPPNRQDFFRMPILRGALPKVKDANVVLYHFLPPIPEILYSEQCEKHFAISREEYEAIVARMSCLVRIPHHDANSISAAEFLMAGRPVISDRDLPQWPAWIKGQVDEKKVIRAINQARRDGFVPPEVSAFYRDLYDPGKFKDRLEARCQERWGDFHFDSGNGTSAGVCAIPSDGLVPASC